MPTSISTEIRWFVKKVLPKSIVDGLRSILPESIYYPGYGHTTLNKTKIENIIKLLNTTLEKKIHGNLIECGVFRGGSLTQIGLVLKQKKSEKHLYGVDSFEGHPFDDNEDIPADGKIIHQKGLFSDNKIELVQSILNEKKLSNVSLHKGLVEEVLPKFFDKEKFCFAHLDLDLYQSTKQALSFIVPRMTKGGIIVFDDYGGFESPGVKKACEEILGHGTVNILIDSKDGSQGYWINN